MFLSCCLISTQCTGSCCKWICDINVCVCMTLPLQAKARTSKSARSWSIMQLRFVALNVPHSYCVRCVPLPILVNCTESCRRRKLSTSSALAMISTSMGCTYENTMCSCPPYERITFSYFQWCCNGYDYDVFVMIFMDILNGRMMCFSQSKMWTLWCLANIPPARALNGRTMGSLVAEHGLPRRTSVFWLVNMVGYLPPLNMQ